MKILLTGANGYVGSLIYESLKDQYEFIRVTRKNVDFSEPQAVEDYLDKLDFEVCLHLAANAQTQACEEQPELTHRINVESAISVAKVCQKKNARLIFFSTEQVFNDQCGAPFKETDTPKTISKYGKHKLEVEEYLLKHQKDYVIVRLSWLFGLSSANIKASPNIIKRVMNAAFLRKPDKFAVYEHRGMTYAYNLVKNFDKLIKAPKGIIHFSSINRLNTYESAKYIAYKLGLEKSKVEKNILPDKHKYADNPRDYRLDNSKALELGFDLTTFEEDVDTCLKDFD